MKINKKEINILFSLFLKLEIKMIAGIIPMITEV